MMERWLNGCAKLGLRRRFLQRNVGKTKFEEHERMFTGPFFGHVERAEETSRSSERKTFQVSGSFPRGRPRKR